MTLGALLGIVSYGLLATVTNLTTLYLVWALIGVSHAAVLYEPAFAAITQWFPNPHQRSNALLLLTSFAGFASTIFVPLEAVLCTHFGWRTTVLILTGILTAIVLPLHATLPAISQPSSDPLENIPPSSPSQQRTLLSVLAVVLTLNSIATTGIGVHLIPYLQTVGFSLQEAASVTAFVGAAQVPGRLLFRPLEFVLAPQWRFAFVLLAQALGLFGLLYPSHHTTLIFTVILWGASNGMVTLVRATIIADWFGREHYASIGGYVSSWSLIGRAAAPLMISLVYHQAHSYTPALLMLAGLLTVSCVLILYAERLRSPKSVMPAQADIQ
jgi:predicted MFS family arabinose efflux permease